FGDADAIILIASGEPIAKPGGLDQTYPFLPHPNYYWLTGSRRWGNVLAWEPARGWTHFVRPIDAVERLWEGTTESVEGIDRKEFDDWLKARSGRALGVLGATLANVTADVPLTDALRERLEEARRPKDHFELELVAKAVRATAAGYARAVDVIRPGATEREIKIELEAEMLRHGADALGYDSIVGIGERAAVLHSTPTDTSARAGDVVLIDAGGAVRGYTADVTRTYSASGKFTPEAQAIYDIVLAAELAAINAARAGVEWHDVHRAAARELAEGLAHLGVLRVSPDAACETEAIALFFPHGIGHMVGLGVRDVGGRAPGREEGRLCCGAKVRVDLPILENFLMTVEPGLYFVPALLDDPERRGKFHDAVNWDALHRWRPVGGIRIEDNVLVTDGEPAVLTQDIPK
ncbi:MAG TPA: aminopeptidase P N-terminal domain-containing protein, partial [Lacipirellulaceae bacterium]